MIDVIPLWDDVGMLIDAARRGEAAAKEMLALVNSGAASCAEMREMLGVAKATVAIMSAAQTSAAASIAARERHGDGGAEVLATGAGLSRQEARSQVKTAEALRHTPKLRDAVESGRVSVVNAKRLADAAAKTSAADVADDGDLLSKAESMCPEQFAKETRRWTVERQGDGGQSEHARQRARRCVRVWDGDDGMVHLRGEFDMVTGRRIGNRLRAVAGNLYDADKQARNRKADSGSRRSFDQCMADALDRLTSRCADSEATKPFADICVVAHVDEATGKLIAELPDGSRLPKSVLEELACNAKFTGVVYDRRGRPIWRAHSVRRATDAQRQLLIARDGGCFACGAHPDICDAHHVRPVSEGGETSLKNLVLACWSCHNKIHYFGWQVHGPPGRRTLHPPETVTYGPAHAPERPSLFRSETPAVPAQPQLLESAATCQPQRHECAVPAQPQLLESVAAGLPDLLARRGPEADCVSDDQRANGFRQNGARHSDSSAKSGPAAARAALARARAERIGTPDALADDRGPP